MLDGTCLCGPPRDISPREGGRADRYVLIWQVCHSVTQLVHGKEVQRSTDLGTACPGQDNNEIWSEAELSEILDPSTDDGRTVPEYEFRYKQAVETTDVYLGLDPMGKNPTSTTCEDLVLLVTLPNVVSVGCIDVDLSSTAVTLITATQCAAPQPCQQSYCKTCPGGLAQQCHDAVV